MRTGTRLAIAGFVAVSALAVIAGPAFAVVDRVYPDGVTVTNAGTWHEPDYTVTVDCASLPTQADYAGGTLVSATSLPVRATDTIRVEVTGCTSARIYGWSMPGDAVTPSLTLVDGPDAGAQLSMGRDWASGDTLSLSGTVVEVGPNTALQLEDGNDPLGLFAVSAVYAPMVADPAGTLLETIPISLSLDASPRFTIDETTPFPNLPPGSLMSGQPFRCGIVPGDHPYTEQQLTIAEPGRYTFRVSDVSPIPSTIDVRRSETPLSDPVLVLYRSFGDASPHDGIVGCNDDAIRDVGGMITRSAGGTLMSGLYSEFEVDLQPGSYTLVLTNYAPVAYFIDPPAPTSSSTRLDVDGRVKKSTATLQVVAPVNGADTETASVEIWFEHAALAATGPSSAAISLVEFSAVLVLAGTGAVVMARAAARHRASRRHRA